MKGKNGVHSLLMIFLIVVLAGGLTTGIDYLRMTSGEVPIFNVQSYDAKSRVQTFRGLFYKASRKVTVSTTESLRDSSEMEFSFLIFNLNVPRQFKELKQEFQIETEEVDNCTEGAKLYFANKDIKVYTYCLEKIDIQLNDKKKSLLNYLENDISILDDIDAKLVYLGLYQDQSTLMFRSDDDLANYGLAMYRCHKTNMNDVYIGPQNMQFQNDFCTVKDDDFKWMVELVEEAAPEGQVLPTNPDGTPMKEVIFEDETYRYEFDEMKSNRIFLVTPAVRGFTERKYPLRTIITSGMLTMDELADRGLKFNKIDKAKEAEELAEKAKAEAEAKANGEQQNVTQ